MTDLAGRTASALAIDMGNWNAFYAEWVKPVAQLIIPGVIALLALVALSGLLTRYLVPCEAEAWGKATRRWWTAVGGLALLAVAVFVPLQPMYTVVGDGRWLSWAFPLVLVLPGVVVAFLAKRWPGWVWKHRTGPGITWPAFLALLLVWAVLTSCFFSWGEGNRLIVADIALAVLGLTATATALGQNRRLQVEAQGVDGKSDVAAAEYVMARLQCLGSRRPASLGIVRPTEPSRLASEDLKAVPGGAVATAVARIMYVLRPGLTWRALVTLVDADRVTVTLTRNGHQADCVLISRPALGLLPSGPAAAAKAAEAEAAGKAPGGGRPAAGAEDGGRARAQLLTAAAACVLVRLSSIHRELKAGLCGAEQWQSVALHVIAMEPTLTDSGPKRVELLRHAVKVEPEYGLARIDYLSECFRQVPGTAANRLRFAKLMDRQLKLARPDEDKPIRKGWEVIYLRTLYSGAVMRVNCYLTERAAGAARLARLRQQEGLILHDARARVTTLGEECKGLAGNEDRQVRLFTEDMVPVAGILTKVIDLLREDGRRAGAAGGRLPWAAPAPAAYPSPDLAYDYACLAALVREVGLPPASLGDLEDHLALAVATADDRSGMWGDPSFAALLRDEAHGREIACAIGLPEQPVGMLDLDPFEPSAEKLRAIGVTTFDQFRRVVPDEAGRTALTGYLGCSPLVTAHLTEVAELAALHEDLSRPEVVKVFLDAGISGRAELARRKAADQEKLLLLLSHGADRSGLAGQPAFVAPQGWLDAL
ncbi:hypothetical protein ACGFZP_33915 [Kitasatospora sp. NPDC048239]|uniref:hypothetical protein n=1 Tax=Kitasatospora sp. NPDC048239 TaxID=3364046 RepID=UPI0037182C0B